MACALGMQTVAVIDRFSWGILPVPSPNSRNIVRGVTESGGAPRTRNHIEACMTTLRNAACVTWFAGLLLFVLRPSVHAQSADELAKQTQNPVSSLISLPFQGNWDVGIGDRETTGTTLNIQPVVPFALTEDWNVILRVIMPVLSQPTGDAQRTNGMGDTVTSVFLSPARPES